MILSEIRTYARTALDETSAVISDDRVDSQVRLAFLWAVQAHDWPWLTATVENQTAIDLLDTPFSRVTQVYDTKNRHGIEQSAVDKALYYYDSRLEGGVGPEVFVTERSGGGGVSLRLYPEAEDGLEERFTITGVLQAVEWPTSATSDSDPPTISGVALPDGLHSAIAHKATAALGFQEQIRDIAAYHANEAVMALKTAKEALLPQVFGRIVGGSDVYDRRRSLARPRGWR